VLAPHAMTLYLLRFGWAGEPPFEVIDAHSLTVLASCPTYEGMMAALRLLRL